MKFNYKDKSPKVETPSGVIPRDIIEDKELNQSSNEEIKIDIPSFEESMAQENQSFNIPNLGTESNENIIPPTKEEIYSIPTQPIFEEPIINNTSNIVNEDIEPSYEMPINNDSFVEKAPEEEMTSIFYSDNGLFSNEQETYTDNNSIYETPVVENTAQESTYDSSPLFSNETVQNTEEINSFKEEDTFVPDSNPMFEQKEEIFTSSAQPTLEQPVINEEPIIDSTPTMFNMDQNTEKEPQIENSIFDTNNVNNQNDIALDEVFDKETVKKEKKSLFGAKKEKKAKEPKPPKEKKSLFGKKNKKAELQNRLDEIAQDTTVIPVTTDSLFSDITNTQPQQQENTNNLLEKKPEIEDNTTTFTEQISEQSQVPEFLNLDMSVPMVDDVNLNQNDNNVVTPVQNNIPQNIEPANTVSNDIFANPISDNTGMFSTDSTFADDSISEMEVLQENAKKKKKNPIIIVLVLVVVIAILLVVLVAKLFTPQNDTVVEKPIETPVVNEEVKIDNDTVNSLVEETQQIVNNANDIADNYTENNELPPQVGMDIDEEIAAENKDNKNKTITFTNNGITFEYPAGWSEITAFNTRETDANVTNIVMLGLTPVDTEDTNNMRVTTEETVKSITAKDYFKATEELMKKSFTNIKTRKSAELTIAGREAPSRIYTFTDESGNSIEQFQIYVANEKNIYVITFTSSEKNFAENLETYKEVLKTIQIK